MEEKWAEKISTIKTPSFRDAGYFYAPYIPMFTSPVLLEPDTFSSTKGILTRYGRKILSLGQQYYEKVSINIEEPIEPIKPKKFRSIDDPWEPSQTF